MKFTWKFVDSSVYVFFSVVKDIIIVLIFKNIDMNLWTRSQRWPLLSILLCHFFLFFFSCPLLKLVKHWHLVELPKFLWDSDGNLPRLLLMNVCHWSVLSYPHLHTLPVCQLLLLHYTHTFFFSYSCGGYWYPYCPYKRQTDGWISEWEFCL